MSFSLRRAREQMGLTAADVARLTGLSHRTIAAIDDERFEELPAGIYARSWVREYARAVGADPAAVLDALRVRLPEAPLDLAALADLRVPKGRDAGARCVLAAGIDALVLLGIVTTILWVCAACCGLAPLQLLRSAPVAMAILFATPIALYFWLLGGMGVPTLGPWLLDVEVLAPIENPLSLDAWLQRGLAYAAREAKLAIRLSSDLDAVEKSAA